MVETNRISAALTDFRILAGAKIRSSWQYRTSFLVLLVAHFLVTAVDFVGIAVIFTNTPTLGGWSFQQVAFLYGLALICFGIADFLVGSVDSVGLRVRDGSFDSLLIRPVNALVNLAASEFGFHRLGRILQASVVFVVALSINGIDWTVGRVILVPVTIVAGSAIAAATWVLTSSVSFWAVNTREVGNTFTYGGALAASYPIQLLESWLRILLMYVVPLVFVSYLPSLYILDVAAPIGFPSWMRFAAPVVAVGMVWVARVAWAAGIRHYRSTGS